MGYVQWKGGKRPSGNIMKAEEVWIFLGCLRERDDIYRPMSIHHEDRCSGGGCLDGQLAGDGVMKRMPTNKSSRPSSIPSRAKPARDRDYHRSVEVMGQHSTRNDITIDNIACR